MAKIKDTLYANYISEREGIEIVENESGFITYKISGTECFLANMYVLPEKRRMGACVSLMKRLIEIAVANRCDVITANIDIACDKNATQTLRASLSLNFKVVAAQHGILLIARELGGSHG